MRHSDLGIEVEEIEGIKTLCDLETDTTKEAIHTEEDVNNSSSNEIILMVMEEKKISIQLPASSVAIEVTLPMLVLIPIDQAIEVGQREVLVEGKGEEVDENGVAKHTEDLIITTHCEILFHLSLDWRRVNLSPMISDLCSCRNPDIALCFLLLDIVDKFFKSFKTTWSTNNTTMKSNSHHLWLTTLTFFYKDI